MDQTLNGLIQSNYPSFLLLHQKNQNLIQFISSLKPKMEEIRSSLNMIYEKLSKEQAAISSLVEQSRDLALKKHTLKIFIQLHNITSKIETILASTEYSQSTQNLPVASSLDLNSLIIQCNQLERIANEFNQVSYFLHVGNKFPFVTKISQTISTIEKTFTDRLENLLTEGFRRQYPQIVESCLTSFASLNKQPTAEAIFSRALVHPSLSKILTPTSIGDPPTSPLDQTSPRPQNELSRVYIKMLAWIDRECLYLFEITHSRPALHGYNFITRSIFPPFFELLQKNASRVFSTVRSDIFYENYVASIEFLMKLENYFGNDRELLVQFRDSLAVQNFLKKWNIFAYFQLKFRDIAGGLEDVLEEKINFGNDVLITQELEFVFPSSAAVWKALVSCWGDFLLAPLSHRFFKLSLQIMKRYSSWIETILGNLETLPVLDLTYVYRDVELLQVLIETRLPQMISQNKQMELLSPSVVESMISSLVAMTCKTLVGISQSLSGAVQKKLIVLCQAEIQNIVTIPRAYRLTGKNVMNQPMPYVNSLLAPLFSFQKTHSQLIEKEKWKIWLRSVLNPVIEKYIESASQILAGERQKEVILSKLPKKQQVNAAPKLLNLSDTDKMTLQLILDIKHFFNLLKNNLSLDHLQLETCQRLWNIVADSQHLLENLN
uniref:COG complex component COG2 C-terminal domain-containing protein n=1 Tax=Arcella intermedia TaxID=1963864 RepID=A0A6B2KZ62_9EUKA